MESISERALTAWTRRFDQAKEYFEKAGDLSALMLLLNAMRDNLDGLNLLVGKAGVSSLFLFCFNVLMELFVEEKGSHSLSCYHLVTPLHVQTKTQCAPKAALFVRT